MNENDAQNSSSKPTTKCKYIGDVFVKSIVIETCK